MRKLTTDNIAKLTAYEPGKPIEEVMREYGLSRCIKLASNENPLGPSPKALEAMRQHLSEVGRYPDSSGYYLKRKLSQVHGFPASQIVLGNGSVEIIELIARTFLGPDDEGMVSRQAFIMYWIAIQSVNGRAAVVPPREFTHDLAAMAAAITDRTKLIFIANPNNPTGTMVSRSELDAFFARVPPDVIVVLDEAYSEYIKEPDYPDGLEHLRRGRNVIVLRTFSKVYGLAGIRVGYGFGPEAVVAAMERVRTPFNTSHLSQHAAISALDDHEHVERTYRANIRERAYLGEGLRELGLSFVPSVANFLLVDFGRPCDEVFETLMRRGIIVRPMKGYGFPTRVRLTVGTHPENEELLGVVRGLRAEGLL